MIIQQIPGWMYALVTALHSRERRAIGKSGISTEANNIFFPPPNAGTPYIDNPVHLSLYNLISTKSGIQSVFSITSNRKLDMNTPKVEKEAKRITRS
jgi:hypothetical protein